MSPAFAWQLYDQTLDGYILSHQSAKERLAWWTLQVKKSHVVSVLRKKLL